MEIEEQLITKQDKLLFSLCRKERLLDIMFNFNVYDDGIKKIARYQQYFAVKETLRRISVLNPTDNGAPANSLSLGAVFGADGNKIRIIVAVISRLQTG